MAACSAGSLRRSAGRHTGTGGAEGGLTRTCGMAPAGIGAPAGRRAMRIRVYGLGQSHKPWTGAARLPARPAPPRFVVRTTVATLIMVAGVLTVVFVGVTLNVRERVRGAVATSSRQDSACCRRSSSGARASSACRSGRWPRTRRSRPRSTPIKRRERRTPPSGARCSRQSTASWRSWPRQRAPTSWR